MNKQNNVASISDSELGLLPPFTPVNIEFVEKEVKDDLTYGDKGNGRELKTFFLKNKYKDSFSF